MFVLHNSSGIGTMLSRASFQFQMNMAATTTASFRMSPMIINRPCEKMSSMVSMSLTVRVSSVPVGVRSK